MSTSATPAPKKRRLPRVSLPKDALAKLPKLPKRAPTTKLPVAERRALNRMTWWWLSLVVFAVSLGLVFPSFATVYAVTDGWDAIGQYIILVIAGAVEGFLLGLAQAIAINRGPLKVPVLGWTLTTTVAMAVAWLVGLLPGSVFRPDWTQAPVLLGMIAVILLVIVIVPAAQWAILNRRVYDAWRWILVSAVAFALGVGIFLTGLFVSRGATKVVTTMIAFSIMGWVGIIAFTFVTAMGMRWIARETRSPASMAALAAKPPGKVGRATAKVRERVAPVAKKAATKTKAVAQKAATKVAPSAKKLSGAVARSAQKAGSSVKKTTAKVRSTKRPKKN